MGGDNVSAGVTGRDGQVCVPVTPPGLMTGPPPPGRVEPLIQSDPVVAYIYIAIMSLALMIGTGGNLLILTVIGAVRNLHRTAKVFVINLAAADLCVAAVADPMCVLAVVKGEAYFDNKRWLCETVAALCLTACFCAFLSLALASINRFIFICHNQVYHKIFTTKSCIIACILIWVMAFFFEFPNFMGWGGHYFDPKNHQCIWDRTASLGYTMFMSFALIFFPLLLMLVCFILIFRHIYTTKFNLYLFDEKDPFRSRKILLEALRTARMLLGIFIVFLVCWTPYSVVIIFDFYQQLSVEVHIFVTMLAHLHSSANFVIYLATNRNFRMSAVHILSCKRLSVSRQGGDSSETKSTEIAKICHLHGSRTMAKAISANSSSSSKASSTEIE